MVGTPGSTATRSLVETARRALCPRDQGARRRDVAEHELDMTGGDVRQRRHRAR